VCFTGDPPTCGISSGCFRDVCKSMTIIWRGFSSFFSLSLFPFPLSSTGAMRLPPVNRARNESLLHKVVRNRARIRNSKQPVSAYALLYNRTRPGNHIALCFMNNHARPGIIIIFQRKIDFVSGEKALHNRAIRAIAHERGDGKRK